MKTETLPGYRNLAIALIAGVGLAAALVYLAGTIAALPIPRMSEHLRRDHLGAVLPTMELLGAIPLTLVAWAVGRLLFRALDDSSRRLWIAVGLPWLVYACVGPLEYVRSSGYEISRAISVMLSPLFFTGWVISLLCVPAGLWWASRYGPRSAAPGTTEAP